MTLHPLLLTADAPEDLDRQIEQVVETVKTLGVKRVLLQFWERVKFHLPNVFAAMILFGIGILMIWLFVKLVRRALARSRLEKALHYFVATVIKYVLLGVLTITCIGVMGLPLTPIITALGAVSLAFSLAIKDSLANLAGGIFLLFNCPFKAGDFIELKGVSGTVREIRLTYTLLQTTFNRSVFLPNSDFSKVILTNYSMEPLRCMELVFSVKPESGIDRAREIIMETLEESGMLLREPAPSVRVSDQTDAMVKISCLAWVQPADLIEMKAYTIQHVREKLLILEP